MHSAAGKKFGYRWRTAVCNQKAKSKKYTQKLEIILSKEKNPTILCKKKKKALADFSENKNKFNDILRQQKKISPFIRKPKY